MIKQMIVGEQCDPWPIVVNTRNWQLLYSTKHVSPSVGKWCVQMVV